MTAPLKAIESPDGLAGQSLGAAPCSATRWAAIGDTIETTMSNGNVMTHEITNSMTCAFANELIASGRWQVSPNAKMSH